MQPNNTPPRDQDETPTEPTTPPTQPYVPGEPSTQPILTPVVHDTSKKAMTKNIILIVVILVLAAIAAVGGFVFGKMNTATTTSTTKDTTQSTATTAQPTAATDVTGTTSAGLKLATWGKNVTVSYTDGFIQYTSDGLPNHSRQAEYAVPKQGVKVPNATSATAAPDPTKVQSYNYKITTNPVKASKVTSTSLGTIGVMISGAALFNPYEGDGSTVATSANFTVKNAAGKDIAFLDACNGHPNPMGQYHYHALPVCVTSQVDKTGGPSHIIGLAFDGFPIYGDRDINGAQVNVSQLDRCNGITSPTPEFPSGIYHYVLVQTTTARSSIGCWSGTVDSSLMQAMGPGMRM